MKQTIILVDDSTFNRDYLRSIFENNNFNVLEASTGMEALNIIESIEPDVMMLDLNMPGIGGLDTLKTIRSKGFSFPVIIFTSDYKDETRQKCLDCGANQIIYKPTKPHFLITEIEKLISGHAKTIH